MGVLNRNVKAVSALVLGSMIGYGVLVGCNSSSSGGGGGSSSITVAGKLSNVATASISNNINTFAAADYKMYCVTFNSNPTAATSVFGADGSFALSLPASTPFGCFVNSVATNLPVATVMVQGAGSGFNNGSSTSLNLNSSVDLGSLNLDLANGRVLVPASAVAGVTAPSTGSGISAAEVDNYEWAMSCVKSGNDQMDAACAEFIQHNPKVYLRILQGSSNGETGYGINVWGSYASFAACGGIDFNTATQAAINFTFATTGAYAPVTAAQFSGWNSSCGLRSDSNLSSLTDSSAGAHARISEAYCLAPLNPSGNGHSFVCSDQGSAGNCSWSHSTSVSFTPGSGVAEMYGAFTASDARSAGCSGSAYSRNVAFNVKFTRGSKH